METIEKKENLLTDKNIAEYYSILHNIISGDLLSKERFVQIIKMNMGSYDYLIDVAAYKQLASLEMNLGDFQKEIEIGDDWNNPNAWILSPEGTNILLDEVNHKQKISFMSDGNDEYWLLLKNGKEMIFKENTGNPEKSGMHLREVILPEDVIVRGYDTIIILPYGGDGSYSAGYLQLN